MKKLFPHFLKQYLSVVCIALLSLWYLQGQSVDNRPNVLFIISDDLNSSIEGMGGHPLAKTPHIDRIVKKGVRFTNAHSNYPLCAPSRASLWSGLYPHTSGNYTFKHWRNNNILKNTVMLQQHFMDNGYHVLGTGKLQHNNHEDKSSYHTFKYDADFGPWPWDGIDSEIWDHHPSMAYLFNRTYRSFGKDARVVTHGKGEQTFGPLSAIPEWESSEEKSHDGWYLEGRPFKYLNENNRNLMPDERNTDWAISQLDRKFTKPFFLGVGFNRPHTPLYVPKKYFDLFPLEEIQLPPYLENDIDDCPKEAIYEYGFDRFNILREAGGVLLWKKWIQAYLASVAFVDDQVGKLMDALEKSPYAKNTIIIFTSDHGYHMGEKDVIFKNTLWEEATRIPLIVHAPGVSRTNEACHRPVSLIDLYPTLIDLCGLPKNPNASGNDLSLDGYSIRPFLENPKTGTWDGPSIAFTEKQGNYSVRSARYRYSLYKTGEEELYDHEEDPHEWKNRADNTSYYNIKKDLRLQLIKLLAKNPNGKK